MTLKDLHDEFPEVLKEAGPLVLEPAIELANAIAPKQNSDALLRCPLGAYDA